MSTPPVLDLRGVQRDFGGDAVLRDVSLTLEPGVIACLTGPSGCGKSTLLRAIAGLEPVQAGQIMINGTLVADARTALAPEQRHVGLVFQEDALFPHLNVAANVAFGLQRQTAAEQAVQIDELLTLVGLRDRHACMPHELSGGERQRIALARALAPQPALLLLDECFANLDAGLRVQLAADVRRILVERKTTALFVTHDQEEAFALASELGVMSAGRIEQWGSPAELYHQPASPFVACFLGSGCWLQGTVSEPGVLSTAAGTVAGPDGFDAAVGDRIAIWVRPEAVILEPGSAFPVRERQFRGMSTRCLVDLPSGELLIVDTTDTPAPETVSLRLNAKKIKVFPESTSST